MTPTPTTAEALRDLIAVAKQARESLDILSDRKPTLPVETLILDLGYKIVEANAALRAEEKATHSAVAAAITALDFYKDHESLALDEKTQKFYKPAVRALAQLRALATNDGD